jgi:hypothetical protein
MKPLQLFLCSLVLTLLTHIAWSQVTTSAVEGIIRSKNGEALSGANVKLTHQPTGSVVSAMTTNSGRYFVVNLQPGGPYTIEASFVGYKIETRTNVFLDLGENSKVDFSLLTTAQELKEVVISNKRGSSFTVGGVGTSIAAERFDNLPTVGRNLTDFVRLTPQAKTTFGGGIAIAGQNNRYNQIMFDGAVNNDVFGLSESGTNGGQTGSSPISVDAIESFQIGVSPYDVSLGNFTGGSINAITKSGTNTTKGSAYWISRNENTAGKRPTGAIFDATKLPDFQANTFGITLGGALRKNKLFYFVSAEIQRDERPQPFDPNTFRTPPGVAFRDSVNLILQKLKSFGYDPGEYLDIPDLLESNKIAAKLTWNLNPKHRLNISYRYTNSERSLTSPSTSTRINFFNGGYFFPSTTHSGSFELNSRFSNKISNKLLVTFTNVFDDRDPLGKDFPRVTLNSVNSTSYVFGTENFSTGNQLKQNNTAVFNELRLLAGNHQLKAGLDVEFSNSYNLFVRDNYGTYTYNWVGDFLADRRPAQYSRSFSLRDNITGDGSAAGTEFNTLRAGFFIGDQWRVNDKLTFNLGVRADNFEFLTTPNEDTYFNNTALPVITNLLRTNWAPYVLFDIQDARSGQRPQPQLSLSPRLGFGWEAGNGWKVRGGIGAFTGRVPLVWPGGVYNNTGVNIGGVFLNNPNITFRSDAFNQYKPSDLGVTVASPSGQIDLIAKNFKLPKVLKSSVGFDKTLGNGWKWSTDILYQWNLNEIVYYNIFGMPGVKNALNQDTYLNISGTSTVYNRIDFDPLTAGVQNPYSTGIFVIANGTGQKGYSYNLTTAIDKSFANGWSINLNYGYGDSYTLFDGTSSQNNSQWRFVETKNGRNNISLSRSDFAQLHRISSFISKRITYAKDKLATSITLFYNGQSGSPYSYVFSRSMIYDQNGANGETTDLIYIPKDLADWSRFAESYVANGVTYTVEQQWAALDQYISKDKHLNEKRGTYADRNGAILPWSHVIDLKLQQDLMLGTGKRSHKVSVQLDMFNFTNFLSRNWGKVYVTPGFDSYSLISMEGYRVTGNTLTPRFTYRNLSNRTAADILDIRGSNYLSTRWRGQLTVRYTF